MNGLRAELIPALNLDIEAICARTGISFEKAKARFPIVEEMNFDAYSPQIFKFDGAVPESIVENFSEYDGVSNWRVTDNLIRQFVSQFPLNLRDELIFKLEKFVVLGRQATRDGLDKFLKKIGYQTTVAPFTSSSGSIYLNFAKHEKYNSVKDKGCNFNDGIINYRSREFKDRKVLFLDDNICTGFQATAVILKMAGVKKQDWPKDLLVDEWDKVANHKKIPEDCRSSINFGFLVGFDSGLDKLRKVASDHGFSGEILHSGTPYDGVDPSEFSEELKDYLADVGAELLSCSRGNSASLNKKDALGYGNVSGFFSSKFNAPTSLITAFWHPGTFRSRIWLPLVLRRGYEKHLRF